MKNEILDTPIKYSFPNFLGQGETIIWKGKPCFDNIHYSESGKGQSDDFSPQSIYATLIFIFVLFFVFKLFNWISFTFLFVYLMVAIFFAWLQPTWNRIFKRNFKYAITQNQILFQIKEKWWYRNPVFHSIPLSEIRDIIVIKRYDVDQIRKEMLEGKSDFHIQDYKDKGLDKIGSIILVPHHPELIPFETKDLTNNNKRHQPSLELLEDVEKVAKMIQEGIRTNAK